MGKKNNYQELCGLRQRIRKCVDKSYTLLLSLSILFRNGSHIIINVLHIFICDVSIHKTTFDYNSLLLLTVKGSMGQGVPKKGAGIPQHKEKIYTTGLNLIGVYPETWG